MTRLLGNLLFWWYFERWSFLVMAFWSSLSFQNLLSFIASKLETLHDMVMVWLVLILTLVILITVMTWMSFKSSLTPDSLLLEQMWTLLPMLILISIAYPSIHLLCSQDVVHLLPTFTSKLTGNQWNWQSESVDVQDHLLDSEKMDELASFDYPLVIPVKETVRMLISSSDVLHSFGLPSLGVKLDATPGRLNTTSMVSSSFGLLVGSCYELCGSGHSAMPIYILSV